jgi:hypothetical protein
MALWHLLIGMCIAVPVGTAFAEARDANVGPGGYILAIGVGLAVGVFCGWAIYVSRKIVLSELNRRESSGASQISQERYARAFYFAQFLWLGFAGFLGGWLSSVLLRIVF